VPGPAVPAPVPVVAVAAAADEDDDAPTDGAADDAPDGPPREAETTGLRAVPPLAAPGSPVGPFTVVESHDAGTGEGAETPADR
jgi:hypothetical protein